MTSLAPMKIILVWNGQWMKSCEITYKGNPSIHFQRQIFICLNYLSNVNDWLLWRTTIRRLLQLQEAKSCVILRHASDYNIKGKIQLLWNLDFKNSCKYLLKNSWFYEQIFLSRLLKPKIKFTKKDMKKIKLSQNSINWDLLKNSVMQIWHGYAAAALRPYHEEEKDFTSPRKNSGKFKFFCKKFSLNFFESVVQAVTLKGELGFFLKIGDSFQDHYVKSPSLIVSLGVFPHDFPGTSQLPV